MKRSFLGFLALMALACNFTTLIQPSGPEPQSIPLDGAPTNGLPVQGGQETQAAPVSSETPTSVLPSPEKTVFCANLYLPASVGTQWQYQLSGLSSDTFTRSITGADTAGFTDQDVFSSGTTRQGTWQCQNGDIINLTPGGGIAVTTPDDQTTFTIESNSGVSLPANPQPGQSWNQQIVYLGHNAASGADSRNVMNMACQAAEVEEVQVPAGAFEALRVNCQVTIDISINGAGVFIFSSQDTSWYAAGVGMVKSSGSSNMGSTEIVLTSYTLP